MLGAQRLRGQVELEGADGETLLDATADLEGVPEFGEAIVPIGPAHVYTIPVVPVEFIMRSQHKTFDLFADYHQFYLWDPGMAPEAPEDYTAEDTRLRIKIGAHVVVIQTERNMTVAVEVEIPDCEPPCDADRWDHIVEASLHLPTGQLQVHECTGGAVADFRVGPGWYRVRSHHGGFDTIDESGLEGNDHYLAALWPAPPAELRVIKQWEPMTPA